MTADQWRYDHVRSTITAPSKQRLVSGQLPRGAYGQAPILIVDEPTAALDPEAELDTFARIQHLAQQGRTIVLITHRMASVRMADLVHVLEGGQLIESGTPQELLTAGGRYAQMFQAQASQFTTATPAMPSPTPPATPITDSHMSQAPAATPGTPKA
ncbi:hypothetical protein [Streptomyces aidingensis]|uniref:ATP-binding cassette, subfamily B n=1 Tax=Streptomyces aidingensis TaxID=910347 RepID=A0A1I1KXC9_9ACTN|nr:hypothetical protein SAMN05421773_104318 [Streptomyces aidingensis]